ncbi:MAG TPA: LytTR family DNA-binding domain-containing protein [Cyclobacteriaceae bacterium]|nr:LytTR family DNA-binding domain-containing protein [Cyclobacteriaceae bacterium]
MTNRENGKAAAKAAVIKQSPKRILLNTQGQILVLDLDDIIFLKSSSNYTIIKMRDGTRYTSSKHLKSYSETIDANPDFLRIHRSSIINKNFVKAIFRKSHKTYVLMKDNEELDVSAKKRELILTELSK